MTDNDNNNGNKSLLQADHDLLIRLDTKMDRAGSDIKELHNHISTVHRSVEGLSVGIDNKIAKAIEPKIDRAEVQDMRDEAEKIHSDHEKRIRQLERYTWSAIGALALAEILIAFLK